MPAKARIGLEHAEDASGYPMGEGRFRSDDQRYPKQGGVLRVGELGVSFSHGAE